ncbi:MAG: nucleotide exchange factor GrpE [Taibaiella sp.]|nr:nucleotide exchange factor GrpE [Taibaiella sp.]
MNTQETNLNNEQEQPIDEQSTNETTPNAEEQLSALEQCQAELAEMKDKYLRQVAEFDNFRKRNAKERIELIQTAGKDIITELLEVIDDMDRAAEQMEKTEDVAQIKAGTQLVFSKLKRTLENKGLKAMDTKNADFDVEFHEAITEIPAPTPDLQGKVIDELQKGYFLNDKLIRHAKVVVGK